VSVGTHPAAQHIAAGRISVGATKQLAYTGDDPSLPLGVGATLLALGLTGLGVARFLRRREAHCR